MRVRLTLIVALCTAAVASALVMTDPTGRWPADWPKAMEPLRATARTVQIAASNQEDVYDIPFADRAAFEAAWPTLRALATPGTPIRVVAVGTPAPHWGGLLDNARPAVRVIAPPAGVRSTDPKDPVVGPPWPTDLIGPHGELPAYVTQRTSPDGARAWVDAAAVDETTRGFAYRCRVEVEVVADGRVIDAARLDLPTTRPAD